MTINIANMSGYLKPKNRFLKYEDMFVQHREKMMARINGQQDPDNPEQANFEYMNNGGHAKDLLTQESLKIAYQLEKIIEISKYTDLWKSVSMGNVFDRLS